MACGRPRVLVSIRCVDEWEGKGFFAAVSADPGDFALRLLDRWLGLARLGRDGVQCLGMT
jgi:hypothetical protein